MADNINSKLYWDERFGSDWVAAGGPQQSVFFAKIALLLLPSWLVMSIRAEKSKIVDWGCAEGAGTAVIKKFFPQAAVTGVDFSDVAIKSASIRYPSIEFVCDDWLKNSEYERPFYDVVFSSNTLEHFEDPMAVLKNIASRAISFIVLALPFNEIERCSEHFFSFSKENIPYSINDNFKLIFSRVLDCRNIKGTMWEGEQIVLVYAASKKIDYFSDLKLVDVERSYSRMSPRDLAARM